MENNNVVNQVLSRGEKPIGFNDAQFIKKIIGDFAYDLSGSSIGKRIGNRAYGIVNKALDDAVDEGAKKINDPKILATLKEAKKTYGVASQAVEALKGKKAREEARSLLSLTDWIMLLGGVQALGIGGIGGLALKRGIEKFGAGVTAVGANKASNILSRLNQKADQFGKFLPILREAADRGATSVAATHYVLLQKFPDFKKLEEKNSQ